MVGPKYFVWPGIYRTGPEGLRRNIPRRRDAPRRAETPAATPPPPAATLDRERAPGRGVVGGGGRGSRELGPRLGQGVKEWYPGTLFGGTRSHKGRQFTPSLRREPL